MAVGGTYSGMERNCWVCFATDLDDRSAEWVSPCRCKGSTKWIHQACLQRWLDEKQKGNSTGRVACPQCNTEYLIVFPKLGPVVYSLHQVDRILSKASPFAAASIVVGTVYWSAVTYGAVTVMQVVGHKKGLDLMERADPLFLLMGLPTIPVMLILAKMIRWEDFVLRMWRRYSSKLQVLSNIFPGFGCPVPRVPAETSYQTDHMSVSRILCGALIFPTISSMVGKLIFSGVNSNLQRTILALDTLKSHPLLKTDSARVWPHLCWYLAHLPALHQQVSADYSATVGISAEVDPVLTQHAGHCNFTGQ
ncbi:E3 ubiquitin-protein ligase MARCHF5-like isoform X1 [Scyliorhinus canicula]|uniref:E3 ubiquitin-protein ligase MARCHF5-like isoform X1 n=1 Tax=Scyliorhinus canicula TaxID=7830 RepID=UPI0018F4922C|nr:E3 ubiquitin-protein ligase MARCHF5-like isoform X1 [Scyliorhinus canicula]